MEAGRPSNWGPGLVVLAALAYLALLCGVAFGAEPPAAAKPYERVVIREGRAIFGMSAPAAMFGAQIQTESAWRPNAHSPYAAGLAQFIPSTATAMARRYPLELGGGGGPLNPGWSIRALVRYDRDLYKNLDNPEPASECDRWAFTLSAYNGGPGWIPRDIVLCVREGCDPSRWWGNVEFYTSRSKSNAQQNREYPRRILIDYQPTYRQWGGFVTCLR